MAVDPTVVAAIINAGGRLLEKLLELASRDPPEEQTSRVLAKAYDKVADAVTPNSLRALIALREAGAFQTPEQIRGAAQKMAARQEPDGTPFELDIKYRLLYAFSDLRGWAPPISRLQ